MEETSSFNTDFSLSMTSRILRKQVEMGGNFVSSPLSFQLMLNLVATRVTGETSEQLLQLLGSKDQTELNSFSLQLIGLASIAEGGKINRQETSFILGDQFFLPRSSKQIDCFYSKKKQEMMISQQLQDCVCFVNGVWVDKRFSLNPSFKGIATDVYNAKTEEVDFVNKAEEERVRMNLWAEAESRGLIQKLLPLGSVDSSTAIVLGNAFYFKGSWNQRFDASQTTLGDFHLLDGQVIQVPFMTAAKNERYMYGYFGSYRILQIPYQTAQDTRKYSMYFFLPEQKDMMLNLVDTLNSTPGFFNQKFTLSLLKLRDFWIPRFKFDFLFEASESMKEMGLQLPICPGMVNSDNNDHVHLSKVFQKSYIEVNEEGTEAAASTAARISRKSARHPTPRFVADHPFMFMIREEASRTVFFLGAVVNPLLPN